jgi:hypothetical protein
MARTPKLNDLQLILLSTASQRESGCLLPYPDQLTAPADRIHKDVTALLRRGLVEETATREVAQAWRNENDQRFTLVITSAGLHAMGAGVTGAGDGGAEQPASAWQPARETKASIVLGLLGREQGATLPELIDATAWLPHTTRAALTGLHKMGHSIERTRRDDVTCYRITEAR